MNRETCKALETALMATPDNHALREQVAIGYFNLADYEKAKEHFSILLEQTGSGDSKLYLAKTYRALGDITTGLVICEDVATELDDHPEFRSLFLDLMIQDGQLEAAVEKYQHYLQSYADWRDETVEERLMVKVTNDGLDDEEDEDEYYFMEKPDIKFEDVGGMKPIKEDIRIKIIEPLNNPDLYAAFGKKAGGGILLYGPPGCGKTYLAKATAGEINSKFISIGLEEILDMYIGNSERNLHHKFDVARRHNPCVLFFDEIDALGSKRSDLKSSAGRNLINKFLQELDGVDTNNDGVLILGATNSPWHMDSAFLRPGRFDQIIFVGPPDVEARERILELHLVGKPAENIDRAKVAAKTAEFSGADLKLLVDTAIEEKLRDSMKSGKVEPVTTKTLLKAIKRVRPSTKEWFNSARNYALYSNASGMYDDILKYLKL